MAVLTPAASPSIDTVQANQVVAGNLYAGEALDAVAPCYIASDGLVYMCDGVANAEAAKFNGFTARAAALGAPVTLFGFPSRFKYSSGMTPGAVLYLAAVNVYNADAGRLDTVATVGDTQGTAVAVSATDIVISRVSPLSG